MTRKKATTPSRFLQAMPLLMTMTEMIQPVMAVALQAVQTRLQAMRRSATMNGRAFRMWIPASLSHRLWNHRAAACHQAALTARSILLKRCRTNGRTSIREL